MTSADYVWMKWLGTALAGGWTFWNALTWKYPDVPQIMQMIVYMKYTKYTIDKYAKMKPLFTPVTKLEQLANNSPTKPFIKFEDETWSYGDINKYSNKIGRYFKQKGVGQGDVISILMTSQPLFVATWFGVGKTGATSSLINHNLRQNALMHSIRIGKSKYLVVSNDEQILEAVREVWDLLQQGGITVYLHGDSKHPVSKKCVKLTEQLATVSNKQTPLTWRDNLTIDDSFMLIFTSGTTGLPKAANISFSRAWRGCAFFQVLRVTSNDVVYTPLPLYHSAGAIIGIIGCIDKGATIVVKKKFSVGSFWDDCRKHHATVVQYIGETMHYLCSQPRLKNEKSHSVRLAIGNGLRPNVWKEFIERFGNVQIGEFYGATEGVSGFINVDSKFGSVGKLIPFIKKQAGYVFAKYDYEKDEIIRDSKNRVVEVAKGEPGLFLCEITPKTSYEGYYKQKEASNKKIVHDVLVNGDKYFNTGDILSWGNDNYIRFVDRVGDTFRWKGENVSTNEVSDAMKLYDDLEQVNVYGVEVPYNEGRAGMMAISLKEGRRLNCKQMYKVAEDNLASYAQPLFARVVSEHQTTGNHKLRKVELVKEGFNPMKTGDDEVYYLDRKKKTYSRMTTEVYEEIVKSKPKL